MLLFHVKLPSKTRHVCTLDCLQAGFINMGQELSVLRHYLASGKCLDCIEDPAGFLVDLLNESMLISFSESQKCTVFSSPFHH